MNSIGRPSGSWNCKSRMTSFTSAITLRAAIVSSLQCMHLLMGTIRREIEYNFLIMLSSPSLPNHQKNIFTLLSPLLNDSLLWVPHSFERLTLLSGPLSWALYWVTNSFEHSFLWFTLESNSLSPRWSGGTCLITFLSTQASALIFKSPFLSWYTLASALLGAF